MDQPYGAAPSNPFEWKGDLAIIGGGAQVLERCSRLKFSGIIQTETLDGNKHQLALVAGEVPEIGGGDPQTLAKRQSGSFLAAQRIPDLRGVLTDVERIRGYLTEHPTLELLRFCEEYRLSSDLELTHEGRTVGVGFASGRVAGVRLDGKPDLGALNLAKSWTEGSFRITLRPLFGATSAVDREPWVREQLVGPTEVTSTASLLLNQSFGATAVPGASPRSLPGTTSSPALGLPSAPMPAAPATASEVSGYDETIPAVEMGGLSTLSLSRPSKLGAPPEGAEEAMKALRLRSTGGWKKWLLVAGGVGALLLGGAAVGRWWHRRPATTPAKAELPQGSPRASGPALARDTNAAGRTVPPAPTPPATEPPSGANVAKEPPVAPEEPNSEPAHGEPTPRAIRKVEAARAALLVGELAKSRRLIDEAEQLGAPAETLRGMRSLADDSKGAGTLSIETRPAGASIQLDGVALGEAPLKLKAVGAGRHVVSASGEGLRPTKSRVLVRKNRGAETKLRLKKARHPRPSRSG
jgi:hypothetical protein